MGKTYRVDKCFGNLYDDFQLINAKSPKHAIQIYLKDFLKKNVILSHIVSRGANKARYSFEIMPVKVNYEIYKPGYNHGLMRAGKRYFYMIDTTK